LFHAAKILLFLFGSGLSGLGNNVFKIRLAVASKGKGKRGGIRIITCFKTAEGTVYLLSIYNKGDRDTVPDNEIQALINGETTE
jgi:hypothetical protein